MESADEPADFAGPSKSSGYLYVYPASSRHETRMLVSLTICTSLTFSDGIDKLRVQLACRGGCDSSTDTRPLEFNGDAAGATRLTDTCWSDAAAEDFPSSAAAEPFTGTWLPRLQDRGEIFPYLAEQGVGRPGSAPRLALRVRTKSNADATSTGQLLSFRATMCFARYPSSPPSPPTPPSPPLVPPPPPPPPTVPPPPSSPTSPLSPLPYPSPPLVPRPSAPPPRADVLFNIAGLEVTMLHLSVFGGSALLALACATTLHLSNRARVASSTGIRVSRGWRL